MKSIVRQAEPSASGRQIMRSIQRALRGVREAYGRAIRECGMEPEQFDLLTLLIEGPKHADEIAESLALTSDDPDALVRRSIAEEHVRFDARGRLTVTRDAIRLLETLKPTLEEINRR